MDVARTSDTHPLRIAEIAAPGGGRIGITLCPGKWQEICASGAPFHRDVDKDLAVVKTWGAALVATLIEPHEFAMLRVERLGSAVADLGMAWRHMPIPDRNIPGPDFLSAWPAASVELHTLLDGGGALLVHCMGGLGRAGTVASMLLVERGMEPAEAIAAVRAVRPGAVETEGQERFLLERAWGPSAWGTAQPAATRR